MKINRAIVVLTLLIATAIAAFAIPRPKYTSPDILSHLAIPMDLAGWHGTDIGSRINLNDLRLSFISQVFARDYKHTSTGAELMFLIVDGRNVHQPKICLTGAGYTITELPDAHFTVAGKPLTARLLRSHKNDENTLIIYWLCIDKKTGAWNRLKLQQLFLSFLNRPNTGLMVRLEIPCTPDQEPEALKIAQSFLATIAAALPPAQSEYLFGK